ncbi:MAG: hypothetical protein II270_07055 [Peptococcaceae bacterium]|jgi:hypothetical protein|nr:hypothetical protein [Peptococcaceae bacterium]
MSDSFEKAERSCFNLTHYAKLIPESHAVFVMPPGCSRILRLSSIEEGMSHRFTMFNLEQSDIINGSVEDLLLEGAERTLKRLTEDGRRPKILSVFASCVDSFIGTDREFVIEQLQEKYPDVIFFNLAVDPINRDSLPPLVRVHNTITALFEKTGSTRTANWLGHYLRPDENHPLLLKLQQSNITSRHLLDCETVEELRQMGNAAVNIVAGPMALPAARILKNRFGTPYYNLVNPADPDSLSEEALLAL